MKFVFGLIISFLSTSIVFSQNYVDILKISANTTSLNKFDSSSATTRVNELVTDLTVPIKLNDSNAIVTGVIYETFQTKLFANQNEKSATMVILKAGWDTKFNSSWSGTFVVLPKVASNFVTLGNKDFQLGGIAILKYKKKQNLNYRIGLYYNGELFGPLLVPMLGLYYISPNKKIETTIMMPLQADFAYKLHSHISVGFYYNAQIKTFHLTDITPTNPSTYVTKSSDDLFGYFRFEFGKGFSLYTRVGQSVDRHFHVYDQNDKVALGLPAVYIDNHRKPLNTNFENGLIYQVMLLYRFSLPE